MKFIISRSSDSFTENCQASPYYPPINGAEWEKEYWVFNFKNLEDLLAFSRKHKTKIVVDNTYQIPHIVIDDLGVSEIIWEEVLV